MSNKASQWKTIGAIVRVMTAANNEMYRLFSNIQVADGAIAIRIPHIYYNWKT